MKTSHAEVTGPGQDPLTCPTLAGYSAGAGQVRGFSQGLEEPRTSKREIRAAYARTRLLFLPNLISSRSGCGGNFPSWPRTLESRCFRHMTAINDRRRRFHRGGLSFLGAVFLMSSWEERAHGQWISETFLIRGWGGLSKRAQSLESVRSHPEHHIPLSAAQAEDH